MSIGTEPASSAQPVLTKEDDLAVVLLEVVLFGGHLLARPEV
jgi:hypothetical protein